VIGPGGFSWVAWVLVPLAAAVAGGAVAAQRSHAARGAFYAVPAKLSVTERQGLESGAALAVANATWAFGSGDSVKKMLRFELDRLPEADGQTRARTLVRFGIVDQNPEGQAAIFSQACAADTTLCDHEREAAQREVERRLVPPGNHLPIYFIPNHPPIYGFR
jgi:hypothetical protein